MSWLEKLGLRSPAQSISPSEAHRQQLAGELTIIDVRQPNEWATTGMPLNSSGITLEDKNFAELVGKLKADNPHTTLALSCKTGMRSQSAARILHKHGMLNLSIVNGGIGAWQKAGLPLKKT